MYREERETFCYVLVLLQILNTVREAIERGVLFLIMYHAHSHVPITACTCMSSAICHAKHPALLSCTIFSNVPLF